MEELLGIRHRLGRLSLALTLLLAPAGAVSAAGARSGPTEHFAQNMPASALWGWTFGSDTLANRMKVYHATAVSIAVIDNYKIAWTKGFGVTGPGSATPVTDKTLFLAGSVS